MYVPYFLDFSHAFEMGEPCTQAITIIIHG